MSFRISRLLLFFLMITPLCNAQEGLPIYSDYLTDNYYLIFPSMAGVANCAKFRLTSRQQWVGQDDAPRLMTASVNSRIGDSPSAVGAILYSDKNGYHSQNGGYVTYAHHLMFSRNEIDLNMLSFGLSAGFIQYRLDESEFLSAGFDPIISGIQQSSTNFNIDFGMSYHFVNAYLHATVKNVLKNDGINNDIEITNNLRRYIFAVGNVFDMKREGLSLEPSILAQYEEGTNATTLDFNLKMYQDFEKAKMYFGISYRQSLDGTKYLDGSGESEQKSQYISPLVGFNYKQFVFAYTYSYQANAVVLNNGGFHMFSLGYNFNCRKIKYQCDCPSVK
ncbi:type IX secretion system membrane protein PorP/SprF [Formosa sp. PL04]|uniref:PorP/SprF family type IX secretion system membrane protein n=1 Tax=Formosa sp. PL04 TaxID=3081755 RepID=UPI00298205FF|nr:type IX secretion system membrane protein PorP/SprF [Formosa sp. PL04]MDW5287350.1 type IX secretion system membrane protein PorP/SprF [Formosa sp. PL04]